MNTKLITEEDFKQLLEKLNTIEQAITKRPRVSPLGDDYLDTKEVARLLNVTPRHVYNWRMDGRIDYVQINGGKVWIKGSSLRQFLESNQIKAFNPLKKSF